MAALGPAEFERLASQDAELVRSYYGLDGNPQSTKKELAPRFGLSVWKVDSGLKRALAMLLAKDSGDALSTEARRKRWTDRISQRRRERGRPLASVVLDLGTEEFDKMGTLERDLVQRYYGIGEERPWTRGELARTFDLSTARVEDLVNDAIRTLTGMEVAPRFERTRAVCGGSFTLRSRVSRRRTCDSGCESELKRAAGRASARTRARRTDALLD